MDKARRIIEYLENTPIDPKNWCVSFGAIIVLRLFIEYLSFPVAERTIESFWGSVLHTLLFFLFSYGVISVVLKYVSTESWTKAFVISLWGQWIIILPPIIDKIIFKDIRFFSFYIFDDFSGLISRYLHFFGPNPDFGITYGTRVEVLVVSFLFAFYVFLKKRKIWLALITSLGFYTLLFFLGSFPSFLAFLINNITVKDVFVNEITVAKIFLSPLRYFNYEVVDVFSALHYKMSLIYNILVFVFGVLIFFLIDKVKLMSLVRNVRYPQMVFNSGLLFSGILLGLYFFPQNISLDFFSILAVVNLWIVVFSSWFFSVFVNDLADEKIDQVTNRNRPLIMGIFEKKTIDK